MINFTDIPRLPKEYYANRVLGRLYDKAFFFCKKSSHEQSLINFLNWFLLLIRQNV